MFCGPVLWDWPEQCAMRGGLLGEGGPLRVAHDAAAVGIEAGEFASRN